MLKSVIKRTFVVLTLMETRFPGELSAVHNCVYNVKHLCRASERKEGVALYFEQPLYFEVINNY